MNPTETAKSKALFYTPESKHAGNAFRMQDGAEYSVNKHGSIVRINRDQRSVKVRKAERRKLRTQTTTPTPEFTG